MARFPLRDRHIVITGASDGIGRSLAVDAAGRGARVTLAARSAAKLEEVAAEIRRRGASAAIVPTDVADEQACRALIDNAIAAHGDIDVLVCNAGIGSATEGGDLLNLDALRTMMGINFMGAVQPAIAALPSLRKRRGLLVAVSSLQGLMGFPGSAAYSASKHAMQGYFDSLRFDLKDSGVDVLTVSPGPVATSIHVSAAPRNARLSHEKIERRSMAVGTCAALIADAIEARSRNLVMTTGGKLAYALRPFVPQLVDNLLERSVRAFYS